MKSSVSIIIVNYNSGEYLEKTVLSVIEKIVDINYEIVVVDNNSSDGSADFLKKIPETKLIVNSSNLGFGKANNIGVAAASKEYLLILNNDTLLLSNTIPPLIKLIEKDPQLGIAAPVILNPDGSLQPSYGLDLSITSEFIQKFLHNSYQKFRHKRLKEKGYTIYPDWVTGACFLISRSLYKEIGGFDENFFIYVEDADICRRVRKKGLKIGLLSQAEVVHFKGQSTSRCLSVIAPIIKESQLYYYKTYNSKLSFMMLKTYLKTFYTLKKFIYMLKKDSENFVIAKKIVKTVKNYRY